MSKRVMCCMMVLCLAGTVFATVSRYTDAGPDHNWNTATNWTFFPNDPLDTTDFNTDGTICQVVDEALAWQCKAVMTGMYGAQNSVIQYTGSITTNGWFNVGRCNTNGGDGLWQIYGGQIVSNSMEVPNQFANNGNVLGKGRLLVVGGVISLSGVLTIGDGTAVAGVAGGGDGQVDVRGGTIISTGDDTGTYQPYIDDGRLIAYGGAPGAAIVMDYDVTTPGRTTITATSGLSESPADKARGVSAGAGTVNLTWTTPADPNFAGLKKYVYFGEKADLNWSDLNDPSVEADFLANRDTWIAHSGLPLVESDDTDNSTTVSIVSGKDYYWQVNYSINEPNVVFSYLFTFDTKNTPPVVDAGYNQYSFLVGGSRILTLDGTLVEDDGVPAPATAVWSVVSALTPYEDGPTAPIDPNDYSFVGGDNNQYNSQFEVLTAGTYILELDAFDGELTAEFPDQVTLFVRDTACKAAQIYPGYNDGEPGAIKQLIGDVNLDCLVDLNDVADLAGTWLGDSSLVDTTEYIP